MDKLKRVTGDAIRIVKISGDSPLQVKTVSSGGGGGAIIKYTGEYEVTPSSEPVVLETASKLMTRNVTVNPIPSNYGLITWNGSVLTVS